MLLIRCPWCGERDQTEFSYGGEADLVVPTNQDELSDAKWGDYLFFRKNPKGVHAEQWVHTAGCRQWFRARRDTVTYQFESTYPFGVDAPEPDNG